MSDDFPDFARKFAAYKKTRRGKGRKPLVTVPHFPTTAGWWVQWSGRTDWQSIDEATGLFLKDTLAAAGDKVVNIQPEPDHDRR
jgi:phosphoribulokinase